MSKILHNPKSHAPAVYIPCWLIQVSIKLLSHGAKLVYGRLSQWCSESGKAHRSATQLSQELGMCVRSIKEYQKELRDVGLIGTYHPQAGGMNHFEFYDHPWMHEPINENLVYKSDKSTPVQNHALPSAESCTTPVQDHARINNKEIKEIKKHKTPCVFFEEFWELFPTKKNKHLCHKLWQTKNLEAIGLEIIQKLQNQIANDDQWKRNFNPHPSTYLSNQLWLDEISKPKIYQVSPPPKNKPTYDDMDTSWRNLECL